MATRPARDPNRQPIHPGALLREDVLPALRVTVADAAQKLGISRQALHGILAERAAVTPEMAVRLGKFCGNGPDIWIKLQIARDLWTAKRQDDGHRGPHPHNDRRIRPPMPHIIPITDNLPLHTTWLLAAEPLHRQLRPQLPATYETYMRRMFAEGAEMAVLATAETIHAIAIYRVHHTTYQGLRFYIDDLVTKEATRSQGHGAQILAWCEARARARNCDTLALDSGVQRTRAHKFYFRENLVIAGYNFNKPLQ